MKNKKKLTESFEKYLCAIYKVTDNNSARVKDIAKFLSIGSPSVSEAMKALEKKKCINYEPYGTIRLTQIGLKIVEEKLERNEIISNFLKNVLQVDESVIEKNSQSIEYAMDEEVLEKFLQFLTFMQTCSCKEPKWIKSFKHYVKNGELSDKCQICVSNYEKIGDDTKICGGHGCNCQK